jgi:hypothetical protein
MATIPRQNGRDHVLDFLRGICILSMALAHFGTPLSRWLNFRVLGFVTGAQGFLLISGLVSGIVYGRVLARDGAAFAERKVWSRIRKLVLHIWFILSIAALLSLALGDAASFQGSEWAPMLQNPWLAWLGGLVFLYQPPIVDILVMYVFFLAALPLALGILQAGRWKLYLAVVAAVYGLGQIFSVSRIWPESMMYLGGWSLPGWQLLFFAGVFLGSPFEKPVLDWTRSKPAVAASMILAAGLFLMAHPRWVPGITPEGIEHLHRLDSTWAEKMAMAPLSVLNFLVFVHLASVAAPFLRRAIPSRNPISALGSRSLEVFSLHMILLLAIWPVRERLPSWFEAPLLAGFLALLWTPVVFNEKRRSAPPAGLESPGRGSGEGQKPEYGADGA